MKVGDRVVAKTDGAGNFVPENGEVFTFKNGSNVKAGQLSTLELTFPQALQGNEVIVLKGGGDNAGADHLFEHTVPVQAGDTTVRCELPKPVMRGKVTVELNGNLLLEDKLHFLPKAVATPYALAEGAVDNAEGTVKLRFVNDLPAGTTVGVKFVCEQEYYDLPHLFYHPQADKKTPFLFNLHPAWAYNEAKDARFGPLGFTVLRTQQIAVAAGQLRQDLALQSYSRRQAFRVKLGDDLLICPKAGLSGDASAATNFPFLPAGWKVDANGGKTVTIQATTAFPAGNFDLMYQAWDVAALQRTAWGTAQPGDGQLNMPFEDVLAIGKILPRVLTEFFRQIHKNQGFIPGLIFIQAALFDTLSCVFLNGAQVGLAQGPGSFLTGSKMFVRPNGYQFNEESEDSTQSGNTQVIGIHEICHSLYFQHAPSAGGNYPEDHDFTDKCLMSYDNSMTDFCGQCLAFLRGMPAKGDRFVTARKQGGGAAAVEFAGVDHWVGQACTQ